MCTLIKESIIKIKLCDYEIELVKCKMFISLEHPHPEMGKKTVCIPPK